jgi:hypothetical protein
MKAHASRSEEELAAYFGGTLTGDMGLRSWLGPMLDRGAMPSSSSSRPDGPSDGALKAASRASLIENTLRLLSRRHLLLLAAYYAPRGPSGPHGLQPLGDVAPLAACLEDEIAPILEEAGQEASRAALRSGSLELARIALEEASFGLPLHPIESLRDLCAASGAGRRSALRTVRRVEIALRRAFEEAAQAYENARSTAKERRRNERAAKVRRALEGR